MSNIEIEVLGGNQSLSDLPIKRMAEILGRGRTLKGNDDTSLAGSERTSPLLGLSVEQTDTKRIELARMQFENMTRNVKP